MTLHVAGAVAELRQERGWVLNSLRLWERNCRAWRCPPDDSLNRGKFLHARRKVSQVRAQLDQLARLIVRLLITALWAVRDTDRRFSRLRLGLVRDASATPAPPQPEPLALGVSPHAPPVVWSLRSPTMP
jgi:hypothetical protein